MVWLIALFLLFICICQFLHIRNTRKQLDSLSAILDDIAEGNLDRRLLTRDGTAISEIAYKINEIVLGDKKKFVELKQSEQAYKKLATSLSHDIRTPLASLMGFLEVLEQGSADQEEREYFTKIARDKALHLREYVQSLFEWMKLESGEWIYTFKEENICELTRIIFAGWIVRLEERNMNFQFDIPQKDVCVITDKIAYERIINNLLSNILRHSQADFLRVTLTEKESSVLLEIADNGIGIPKQDLPYLFDRLYKCDTSGTGNGNGLGLAIARELTSALKGRITATSEAQKGTTFLLEIPLA